MGWVPGFNEQLTVAIRSCRHGTRVLELVEEGWQILRWNWTTGLATTGPNRWPRRQGRVMNPGIGMRFAPWDAS